MRKFIITFDSKDFNDWKLYNVAEGYIKENTPDDEFIKLALGVTEGEPISILEVTVSPETEERR